MNVLMISIDKGLIGEKPLGDVVERHTYYANQAGKLDIIVPSLKGYVVMHHSTNLTAYPTNSLMRFMYLFDLISLGSRLRKVRSYDLMVTQDPFITGFVGLYLRHKFGGRLIVNVHGDFIDNPMWFRRAPFIRNILQLFALFVLRRADSIRVVSTGLQRKLERHAISKDRITVVPTPIDIERFGKGTPQEKPWKYVITMVGRPDPIKDFKTLFKAIQIVFNNTDNVGLFLVGNYNESSSIKLPKDRVRLLGQVSTQKLPDIYATSDIIVLSSRSESFGKVLVEAAASGKPVVSTATEGGKEIVVDGKTGFLTPIGDAPALAKSLTTLLNHPKLREQFGNAGKQRVTELFRNSKEQLVELWLKTSIKKS